jgi:hypothetical protein
VRLVGVDSEFGQLRSVLMRHAGPVVPDLSGSLDPVLTRQLATSRWETYSVERVRAQQCPVHRLNARPGV